ncbi:cytidylyltransferase domain-containing protein [Prochlorococcus marinus]|uniref:CMP-N-acetylneuraminic acid synthetase n=1 Tax=Prochlorococcus marinus (strain MIT 9211) TaxID=93059 RepID=A9BBG1_PROM4|nr:hypothetical protein [Prochlorococcus marinus]ABX09173.1 CMP-N-acetylneuraminic acid synthetase [Prochlorococcus marinus str. MIT 9211]
MNLSKSNLLFIVPARKGSKRIPNKNRLLIEGYSLAERSIATGEQIGNLLGIDYEIVLSTDDEYLIKNTRQYQNLKKVLRPPELAKDSTRMLDVINNIFENHGNENTLTILLQPTTPFRDTKRIAKYIKSVYSKNINRQVTIVATRLCKEKPAHIYSLKGKKLHPILPELALQSYNSQELANYYVLTGGLYVFWKKFFYPKKTLIHGETYNFKVRGKYALDIDTKEDIKRLVKYTDIKESHIPK